MSDPSANVRRMKTSYDCDPLSLSLDDRIGAVVAAEREIARLQARQVRLAAAIANDPCAGAVAPAIEKEYVKEELRAALCESAVAVDTRVALAGMLTERLPATLDALEAGGITIRHVLRLADAIAGLDDEAAGKVEAAALAFAPGRDLSGFCRKVRREVLNLDTRSPEEQLADALERRRVWDGAEQPGMSQFGAVLPAEGSRALMIALDMIAGQAPLDDPRTMDQRRADALVQLGIDALNGYYGCPNCRHSSRSNHEAGLDSVTENDNADADRGSTAPRWQGLRPRVQVIVAMSTLLGVDNQPGELDGYGPIPAELARRIAADASGTWRRLVTDELGRLVDYGRRRYRPPARLRKFVLARDRECMFPTCHRSACRCEIDHVQPWAAGGETNAENLLVLCCRHHHGKHEAGWTPRRLPDGGVEWTSSQGRVYVVPPTTYPIDTTFRTCAKNDNAEQPPEHDERAA